MSFPNHDPNWRNVADFVESHIREGERLLANDIFWWRFDVVYRYANLHLHPEDRYTWAIIHKGELRHIPTAFLDDMVASMRPVFANPVFLVWTSRDDLDELEDHPDIKVFPGLLEQRADEPFQPQPADDFVSPTPGRIEKFEKLSKVELAHAMDQFFDAGGYEYQTPRDQAYTADIDRWLRTLTAGMTQAAVLDAACGDGRVAATLTDYASLLEIDLSASAIRIVEEAGQDDSRRDARVMDAEALDLPDATFDLVTFVEAAEHVHDLSRAVQEIARVLRPGGALIMTCANTQSLHHRLNRALGHSDFLTNYQHIREFSYEEISDILKGAGLSIKRSEGIFLYPYWGVPGVDEYVRHVTDYDPDLVEALRLLGEKAGPDLAYSFILSARKQSAA